MKDSLALLFTATAFALIAWGFWRFLGADGFSIISTLALLSLFGDNIRLRRKLKAERRD